MRFPLSRRRFIGQPLTAMGVATAAQAVLANPGPARRNLPERSSIANFGAIADDATDNSAAIQQAIDTAYRAGGGELRVPAGTFRFTQTLQLRSGVKLQGDGPASVLHFVNSQRGDALRAEGSRSVRLSGIVIRDLTIAGDARFAKGKPSIINGSGIAFVHADACDMSGVAVIGFSDGGIFFLNGNRNTVTQCRVEQIAQGISFTASDLMVTGNSAIGNHIVNTGEYNGLHLEGGFGGKASGEVRHTTLSGNIIADCWEAGINIELAPYTSCVGNTVHRSGLGRTTIAMGIKLYGGLRSAICGNTVADSHGEAIMVGANSGECSIEGNVTAGNGASLLLTDNGAQVSNDVSIGFNSFTEGEIHTRGNVRIRNTIVGGLAFANRANPDPHTLDWYEEGRFQPVVGGDAAVREAMFTRIGNVVHIALRTSWTNEGSNLAIGGLPYPAIADTYLLAVLQSGKDKPVVIQAHIAASQTGIMLQMPGRSAGKMGRSDRRLAQISISGHYLTPG